ncbi:MAG: DUF1727 domain-containing protein [Firmicutes bacterium]|nr:DUF1727 domain-containing protein [Bacillota bacterium]
MKRLKFYLALWCAKLSIVALKVTGHRGTDFPGRIAVKICPDFLRQAKVPGRILGVTGTNGKTTVCNLLISMLTADGKKILDNNQGSNTITGLTTAFIRDMGLGGRCRSDAAVLEIDERSSRVVFPMMEPDFLLINNLTRDSIMRNGHPEYISRVLTRAMPAKTRLILNGDDLIASNVAPANPRAYFGFETMEGDVKECINLVNDLQICPRCHSILEYTNRRYHHIGRAFCPECGFHSPDLDYEGRNIDTENMHMDVRHGEEWEHGFRLLNESVFNIYNVLAVTAYLSELGYAPDRIGQLLDQTEIVKSRFNVDEVGGYRIIRQMSKDRNALGSSRAFDYVSGLAGDKELIMMMNNLSDAAVWSENTCWLYDCDFEFLNRDNIKNIVVTGPRAKDYYLRLKFAGIEDDRISFVHDEIDAPGALRLYPGEDIYVLYGTDSIDLADQVANKVREQISEKVTGRSAG